MKGSAVRIRSSALSKARYRWRGKLCVKPSAAERTSSFTKTVRYAGLTYYCE